jgi:fatty-acyl-CoA synthase
MSTASDSDGARWHFNLADLFELAAGTVPDRTALVAGSSRRTYRELDERSNRLAHHLVENGIPAGAKIGIYSWNRAEWVEAMIGIMKMRGVFINVNYRYVPEELAYLFDNADVEALVLERSFVPLVDEIRSRLPKLRHLIVIEDGSEADIGSAVRYEDALASSSADSLGIVRSGDDLYMLYTGGTTGMPKGVMWRQEDLFFAAMGGAGFGHPDGPIKRPEVIVERVCAEDRLRVGMVVAPIMHGAAQWGMYITLLAGGKVVLYSERGFDPHEVWREAEVEGCTSLALVGDAMARPMAEALEEKTYDLSRLSNMGSGGAVFSTVVKTLLSKHLPHVAITDQFGGSELGSSGSASGANAGLRFTVNQWMTVLGDDLRPVKPGSGQSGMIARRGHIPLGYYKDEVKTAATFVTDPDGVRWAVPGDLGMIEDDGTITLLGRGSQCINTGGEKVFPEEVEGALKSHPDVFDALIVGLPDPRFGERVAAVVQPRAGRTPTLEDLAQHCRTKLAGYKVPRQLLLVESITRTPAGKPNYGWAKRMFEEKDSTPA